MVAIKDFGMPSCCGNCEMSSCKGWGNFYCDITLEEIDMDSDKRDKNCPLIEVDMTEEILEKANDLNHDIKILEEIKDHQTKQHWVGFRVPNGSLEYTLDDFYSDEINNAFKEFVETQLDRAIKLLDEL